MNKAWIAALALALGAAAAPAGKSTTMTGELVDLGCYLSHGGAGAKHAQCAKSCVKDGAPLGLATKTGLFLVVGGHENAKAFAAAKEMAGENAKVTGTLTKKDGLQAIMVEKVEKP
ncbi:MAG: hypothetical protein HY079_14770 [Elusimicrobia bacterium]|nr:hypothetical protein [Elusimicrobiota bacterium]